MEIIHAIEVVCYINMQLLNANVYCCNWDSPYTCTMHNIGDRGCQPPKYTMNSCLGPNNGDITFWMPYPSVGQIRQCKYGYCFLHRTAHSECPMSSMLGKVVRINKLVQCCITKELTYNKSSMVQNVGQSKQCIYGSISTREYHIPNVHWAQI